MGPNNSGKKHLVENCWKVNINDFIRLYRTELKRAFLESKLRVLGNNLELTLSKTGFGGVRFWFQCPICQKRIGILYKHPLNNNLGCRNCLNLEYKSRLYRGMLEEKVVDL